MQDTGIQQYHRGCIAIASRLEATRKRRRQLQQLLSLRPILLRCRHTGRARTNKRHTIGPTLPIADGFQSLGMGGYTYGPALAVERPTVTMDHPIWYLGGVGGFGSYQITGVLTANANGATETPVWTVTTGGTKVNLGCTNCTWTYITALAASSGCTYDVTLQASVGGFPSDIFFIYITGTTITLTQAVAQGIGVITIQ